jgi:hypothetical protein
MREFIIRDANRFWITFGQPIADARGQTVRVESVRMWRRLQPCEARVRSAKALRHKTL